MANEELRAGQDAFLAKTLEASIRIGLVVVLIAWCFLIVKPFIAPVLWGIVIAISSRSVYERLLGWSGGRNSIAAPAFVGLGLFFVIGPAVGLAGTMAEGAEAAVDALQADTFSVPPPPEGIADWPVIGPSIDQTWTLASTNLSALIAQFGDELKNLGGWLLNLAASIGASVLLFSFSIVIAAIFHVNAEGAGRVAQLVARRVAGANNGPRLNELAQSTIRSVTRGILGVAVIQALAAGVGMIAVGVPGAGLWALLVLLLAVMQIPTIAILLPVALYVFSYATTGIAVVFAIWCGLVAFSDNVLKPILLGRGSDVPMLVILIGALGGFAFQGLIGLFIGPIVLSVAYTLTVAWIHDDEDADAREASEA